jgi:hypothetical protein
MKTSILTMDAFIYFPRLPLGIQHAIWSIAAHIEPDGGGRTFELERCPGSIPYIVLDTNEHIPRAPRTLLRVCRAANRLATKENSDSICALWPCIREDRPDKLGTAFVNTSHDTLVITSMSILRFFQALHHKPTSKESKGRLTYLRSARRIRKIKLPYTVWQDMEPGNLDPTRWDWLRSFPSLQSLIVLIGIPEQQSKILSHVKRFDHVDIALGTPRQWWARLVQEWICLEMQFFFQPKYPQHSLPEVKTASLAYMLQDKLVYLVDELFFDLTLERCRAYRATLTAHALRFASG